MYKTIIFDLDDTLNDDTKNMQEAFKILTKDKYSDEEFKKFQTIDKNYWKERAAGIVKDPREGMSKAEKAEWNRAQRFLRYFKGISYEEAVKINDIYTEGLKRKVQEIEGAKEIIKYLKDKNKWENQRKTLQENYYSGKITGKQYSEKARILIQNVLSNIDKVFISEYLPF